MTSSIKHTTFIYLRQSPEVFFLLARAYSLFYQGLMLSIMRRLLCMNESKIWCIGRFGTR